MSVGNKFGHFIFFSDKRGTAWATRRQFFKRGHLSAATNDEKRMDV